MSRFRWAVFGQAFAPGHSGALQPSFRQSAFASARNGRSGSASFQSASWTRSSAEQGDDEAETHAGIPRCFETSLSPKQGPADEALAGGIVQTVVDLSLPPRPATKRETTKTR